MYIKTFELFDFFKRNQNKFTEDEIYYIRFTLFNYLRNRISFLYDDDDKTEISLNLNTLKYIIKKEKKNSYYIGHIKFQSLKDICIYVESKVLLYYISNIMGLDTQKTMTVLDDYSVVNNRKISLFRFKDAIDEMISSNKINRYQRNTLGQNVEVLAKEIASTMMKSYGIKLEITD